MSDYKNIERNLLVVGQAEMQNIVFQILDKYLAICFMMQWHTGTDKKW